MSMYRAEHPNPQFERDNYECLNGTWDFCYGKVGGKENCALDLKIEVPFCPESEMSGIHNTDFITDCVYSREIDVKQSDLDGRLVLHFGAVDYKAEVYVNGVKAGEHEGGYTAFEIEITAFVKVGKNRITVAVHDDINENVPSGKQSRKSQSFGCFYTRATGIWQTVWLERTPKAYIKQVKFYPNIADVTVKVELITEGNAPTEINVYCGGKQVGKATGDGYYRHEYVIQLTEKHLWSIGCGEIYDVFIKFGEDEVKSYFGLRSVEYKNGQFLLNGKSVFQRLVLDQGYYPTSVYTATSVEDIRFDILSAWKLGFNGLRLHQKVFDQRYLYECDRLGVMVWGEYASWGVRYEDLNALGTFIAEWTETVEQHFNHPSIVTWCPLNEAWNNLDDDGKERDIRFIESVYQTTKMIDPTRPCVDVSGGYHGKYTDLFDFHCYHGAEEITGYIEAIENRGKLVMDTLYGKSAENEGAVWNGETPLHASEYGGVAYKKDGKPDIDKLKNTLVGWQYFAEEHNLLYTLFTDNHDQPHFIERGGYDGTNRYEVATMYATMFYLLKGIPFIYQGQEFGTLDPHYDDISDYDDIETINYYNDHKGDTDIIEKINVGSRDNTRRPMCWDNTKNYGFSFADTTWIKLHSRGREVNLENDRKSEKSVFEFYKKLLALRNGSDAIKYGKFEDITKDNG